VALDRDFIDAVRDLDQHELRRLLILATAHLERKGALPPGARQDVKLRQQHVRCGKPNCGRCPHGPYWYAYWREDGRRKSRYVGKLLEEE
jgi:hypothetical protein